MLALVAALAFGLMALSGGERATASTAPQACAAGLGASIEAFDAASGGSQVTQAVVGDKVFYEVKYSITSAQCPIINGRVVFTDPKGAETELDAVLQLTPTINPKTGDSITYDRQNYTIQEGDKGVATGSVAVFLASGAAGATAKRFNASNQTVDASADWDIDVLNPVKVTKTADPAFDRSFTWQIKKNVDPDTWDLFVGDSGTSEYTIDLTKKGPFDDNYRVSGKITVTNNNTVDVTVNSVKDVVDGTDADVTCAGADFPQALAADGGELQCTYTADLADDSTLTNTATANAKYFDLDVSGSGEAQVNFTGVAPKKTNLNEITLKDDVEGQLGSFSETGSTSYKRTFTCGSGADEFEGTGNEAGNTASIVETGASDSATVTINCYNLKVTKDAKASLTRQFKWSIDKEADDKSVKVNEGETATVKYDVTVDVIGENDRDHKVAGTITITNNHPTRAAELTKLNDVLNGTAATVDCELVDGTGTAAGVVPFATVPADSSIECTYQADNVDGTETRNTATATQQNYNFDQDLTATAKGTTDYSGSADVDFENGNVTPDDDCVNVTDSDPNGPQGANVCESNAPTTFNYEVTFNTDGSGDVLVECGENDYPNTATLVTKDKGTELSDAQTVTITVNCGGPTRTPGFWATHTALANKVWTNIPASANKKNVNLWGAGACAKDKLIDADPIKGDNEMMGAFWARISKKSDNVTVRSALDQKRMQLLQQLIAAQLNVYGLGTSDGGLIATAKTRYCEGSISEITLSIGALDTYNNSGDDIPLPFPEGSATSATSRNQADKAFWDNPTGN